MYRDDLELAAGCVHGEPQALAIFEATIMPAVVQTLNRRDLLPWADEVLRRLRAALFTPRAEGRGPEIADYAGNGPLRGFVSAVAMRLAFKLAQRDGRSIATETSALMEAMTNDGDPGMI